jgi:hypothetical protein
MGLSRRQLTKEFKLRGVRRRREFRGAPGNVFSSNRKQRWSEGRIAELERRIGQQALETDFFKECLQRVLLLPDTLR